MMRDQHPDDAVWLERACGEASEGEHAGVEEHLGTCSECQQRLATFEDIVASLRTPRPDNAPLRVLTAILDRQVAVREARRPLAAQPLRLAAALLAGLLLFAGGYSSGRHQAGAGGVVRPTSGRQPFPAPPRLVIEPATAGLGDLALAPWAGDSSHAAGAEPPATRDSL